MKEEEMLVYAHKFAPYRKLMSKEKRAAQFLPFAALTGFDSFILESARETVREKTLLNERKEILDKKLQYLSTINKPLVTITYFKDDTRKSGGKYLTITKHLLKIDLINKTLLLEDKIVIDINKISEIESDAFNDII